MLDSVGSKLALIFAVGFVIVLIGVGIQIDVFSILSKDKHLDIYSIGDVIADPQKYIGKNITVPGYYFQGDRPNGEGYISSELVPQPILEGSLNQVGLMVVNISKVNMTFDESVLYDFTGTLLEKGNTSYSTALIILNVEKVEID